jgi:SAM-dependent methyltransferase
VSTDEAWRQWGEQDPYFAVITDPKYRHASLTDAAKKEFFDSGRVHARYVLDTCKRELDANFKPKRALDFGCGVGRVVLGLAELADHVLGVDVSPAMLDEARRIAQEEAVQNVAFELSDDQLSKVTGRFDLVHSFIVFQHIDVPRGRELFRRLVELIDDGGVGALHVTYAKAYHAQRFGQPPAPPPPPPPPPPAPVEPAARATALGGLVDLFRRGGDEQPGAGRGDPEMQMNVYPLNELFFVLQTAGTQNLRVIFTDHGGELGVFIFFKRTAAPVGV